MKLSIFAAAIGFAAFAPTLLTAPAAQAQSRMAACTVKVASVAKTLHVSPKYANKQNVTRACAINSARPVLSSAEFLRRYTATAPLAAKVAPPKVAKSCPTLVSRAVGASGANPKAATPENMKKACAAAKGRPIVATAGFLSSMTAGVRCMDRTLKSFQALQINPKTGNPKNAQIACGNAKNRPVIAVRNFLAGITRNVK